MDKIVIKSSRWQLILLLIVSLAFVAGGVAMILAGEWFGWVGTTFFGACAAIFVWQLAQTKPRLIIDENGIEDSTLGVGRIAWRDIRSAYLNSINGNPFICLELENVEKYRRRLSKTRRAMTELNRSLGFTDFSINLTAVEARPDEVFEIMMKYCEFDGKNLGLDE